MAIGFGIIGCGMISRFHAKAVADIKGLRFAGLLAWLTWSLVHIMFLIGFRTKLFVMMGWIYDYVFNSREARLITGNFRLRVRKQAGLSRQLEEGTNTETRRHGEQIANTASVSS